jgi:hypothetical protein
MYDVKKLEDDDLEAIINNNGDIVPDEWSVSMATELLSLRARVSNEDGETARKYLEAVIRCEVKHDENGHAYIKVPSRSVFDLGYMIHVFLNTRAIQHDGEKDEYDPDEDWKEMLKAIKLLAETPTFSETPGITGRDEALDELICHARNYEEHRKKNE